MKIQNITLSEFISKYLNKPASCILDGYWIKKGEFIIEDGWFCLKNKSITQDGEKVFLLDPSDVKRYETFHMEVIFGMGYSSIKHIYIYKNHFHRIFSLIQQVLRDLL